MAAPERQPSMAPHEEQKLGMMILAGPFQPGLLWFEEGHHHPVNLTFLFLGGVKEQGLESGTAASLLHAFRFVLENMASVSALSHPHLRQKNQARCAGFAVVDIIYCALNKRCPKENENNVLQQQNMHNKEAIAYGFMGFPTPCSLPPYSFIVLS